MHTIANELTAGSLLCFGGLFSIMFLSVLLGHVKTFFRTLGSPDLLIPCSKVLGSFEVTLRLYIGKYAVLLMAQVQVVIVITHQKIFAFISAADALSISQPKCKEACICSS
jgi:hypothetical protein